MMTPRMVLSEARVRCTASERRSVQIGVVALRTAAVLLGTVCSPQAKKLNGMALLVSATRNNHGNSLRGGSLYRPISRTIQRSSAPNEARSIPTQIGGNADVAMRIIRKEIPQTAESRSICNA